MPSNEQIIEAAKRQILEAGVQSITTDLGRDGTPSKYYVSFHAGIGRCVSLEEAESIIINFQFREIGDLKQSHDPHCTHLRVNIDLLNAKFQEGFEAGKASTPQPWACTDEQAKVFYDRFFGEQAPNGNTALQIKNLINEVLALQPMPEHEPICETQIRAAMKKGMLNYLPGDVRNVTKALNEVLALQPAPECKPITPEQIYAVLYDELRTSPDICKRVADRIASLQPAPVEANGCPDCKHVEGSSTLSPKYCAYPFCVCENEWHHRRGMV